MNLSDQQLAEYRLELLRERIRVEADIARDLGRLLMLLESIVRHTPWAVNIMSGVYAREQEREHPNG
jgi:hypothetical protein